MHTTSEIVLLIIVWSLTSAGLFFGTRAKIRKRRLAREDTQKALKSMQEKL